MDRWADGHTEGRTLVASLLKTLSSNNYKVSMEWFPYLTNFFI